jgi:SAM-dependent methyltransferase
MRAWMAEPVRDPASDTDTIDVLVLGVTVEIVTMPWPRTVRLTAFERSSGMIRAFWPGRLPGCRSVVRADWDAPPFRDEAFDIVVGDGIFNTRHYPNGYLELGMRIRSLLRPGGRLFVRGFTQLDVKEEPEQVIDAYDAGRITDYHALRFRLLTSLQASAAEGTWGNKDFIDQELVARGVALAELYRRTGYEPPHPQAKPGSGATNAMSRVSYPTLAEYERVLTKSFRLLGRRHGSHPLAHRCPIFGLQRLE